MSATVSFITGYPEETGEDQAATLDLMASCFHRPQTPLNVQLHLLTPEPGTELLEQNREKIAYDGHISDFNFPALEPDDTAVTEASPQVFINGHYFPSVLPRGRHIFVTEIYQVLYSLGFPLLNYLTRQLGGGSFSNLINRMYEWSRTAKWQTSLDGSFLQAFVHAQRGSTHHLSGLVTYMLHAAELRRIAVNDPWPQSDGGGIPAFSEDRAYRLGKYARLAPRLPDCPRMLDHLLEKPEAKLPVGLLRSRRNFLLQMLPEDRETVKNYVVTDPAAAVLDSFRKPTSLAEFAVVFPLKTGYPAPPREFIESLVSRHVLQPALG